MTSLADTARNAIEIACGLGATEATAWVSRGRSSELDLRDGQIEKCQESRSLSLSVSLLVDDRYGVHSTSDLRPAPLRDFLSRAVEATRPIEPDPARRLPERAAMGATEEPLDLVDPDGAASNPDELRDLAARAETACRAAADGTPIRSVRGFAWNGDATRWMIASNGFEGGSASTDFGFGADVSLEDEGGRLPEMSGYAAAHHRADLPSPDEVAVEILDRGRRRRGSRPAPSGRYPLLLDSRVAGNLLRVVVGAASGQIVFEGRSCLHGRLGTRIGDERFSLIDDPLVPRGIGSRPHDGDGLPSRRIELVGGGVLRNYLLDVYYGRRLELAPTTGGASNLVVPPGPRSPNEIAAGLGRAIRVEGFLGGNTNPATGLFSFGIHGALLEDGVPVRGVSEMNVSGDLFDLLDRFREAADDPWRYGAWRVPTLFFDAVQFSGS